MTPIEPRISVPAAPTILIVDDTRASTVRGCEMTVKGLELSATSDWFSINRDERGFFEHAS